MPTSTISNKIEKMIHKLTKELAKMEITTFDLKKSLCYSYWDKGLKVPQNNIEVIEQCESEIESMKKVIAYYKGYIQER